jgi:hypothetical protein
MFFLTVFVYPVVLGLLCVGTGLLVDRASGGFLPVALLAVVGAAGLIAVSQLLTYVPALAPGTPYALLAVALAGFVAGWHRVAALPRRWRSLAPLALAVPAYLIAIGPVLAAGRPTLSSYMALTDSAVHMLGADYLVHHGQSFAHLDLHNSYGRYLDVYYNHNYPSGADTLFGGSALLLRLSLFFAYQPFNAFMLAIVTGPALVLVHRVGLRGGLAFAAALSVTVPALVYGYELVGSIKEIATLPMLMGIGALIALHARWLPGRARGAMPIALLVAAGVSAIGIAFGAWALAAAAVLLALVAAQLRARERRIGGALAMAGVALATLLVCAWPTWSRLPGSLEAAQAIASTPNPGNLHRPLRVVQALGTWLGGSYIIEPSGAALDLTYAFVALALVLLVIGAVRVFSESRVLFAWIAMMLLVWLVLTKSATAWADAKTLMLTSPAALLLVWAGVAALRGSRWRLAAPTLAAVLLAGVLVSDALQYHASNLAPTARYQELASLNARFAGQGPALFTDYDEYALYDLRDLDVGGPNFIYAPPALTGVVPSNGYPVDLDRIAPSALGAYPLIVTRRDPAASRPPAAYRLAWEGTYYAVWRRQATAPIAIARAGLGGGRPLACADVARVAQAALAWARSARPPQPASAVRLVAATAPQVVRASVAGARHTRNWTFGRVGLLLSGAGQLRTSFRLPHAGLWDLWLEGQLMPAAQLALDGKPLPSIAGQVGGTSLTQQVMTPIAVRLRAGAHTLTLARTSSGLAPGGGGWADLRAIFLTPAGAGAKPALRETTLAGWPTLCAAPLQWVEAVPVSSAHSARARTPA